MAPGYVPRLLYAAPGGGMHLLMRPLPSRRAPLSSSPLTQNAVCSYVASRLTQMVAHHHRPAASDAVPLPSPSRPEEAWFYVRVTECKEQTFAYMYMAMECRQAETEAIRQHVRAARAAAQGGPPSGGGAPSSPRVDTLTFTECLTELEEGRGPALRAWNEVPNAQRYGTFHVVTHVGAPSTYTVVERAGPLRFAHIDEEIDSMF